MDPLSTQAMATKALSVRELYERECTRLGYQSDSAQLLAVTKLDELRSRLVQPKQSPTLLKRLISRQPQRTTERGLYLWGGVGRGKTFLMDLFFQSLPFRAKHRSHFHHFMQSVHDSLKKHTNQENPLEIIAEKIAKKYRVLCFDEFFVADIGDAMLLGTLFTLLFERGVTLVATSNVPPDGLYKDGLQRARFLPAIEQLKQNTEVVNIDAGIDYRLRVLQQINTWFNSKDTRTQTELERIFTTLAGEAGARHLNIEVNHRKLKTECVATNVIWFTFKQLCDGPRSQSDYIEIAQRYGTVLLSEVPLLDEYEDQTRRFIALVDEFYDCGVKLIASSAAPLTALYRGNTFKFEFQRTTSRLIEMQSDVYRAGAHQRRSDLSVG